MNTAKTPTLADLSRLLQEKGSLSPVSEPLTAEEAALTITGADCDSRVVKPHHLFICKGAQFKSNYLSAAKQAGTVAYLCDEERADELKAIEPTLPALVTNQLRPAMADVSAAAFGHPDRELTTIGITGTKGKSTTGYMVRSVLEAGSQHPTCGLIGSVEYFDGIEQEEAVNTTPESPDLWRHIANMRDSGLPYAVMEISSQALKYNRVDNLSLDVGAFLNIGYDHISPLEHPTWEDYFQSKLKIFDHAQAAVVNLNSDHADRIMARSHECTQVLTFSTTDSTATVSARDIQSSFGSIQFVCTTPSWKDPIKLVMPGLFNVDNALAAIAICEYLHIPYEQVAEGLAHTKVPGRMELIPTPGRQVMGIVDFAHNKMSFEKFFPNVKKEFPGYKVIAVFGATGDKAVERRYELPKAAAPYADKLIYTLDDPGYEKVEDICRTMAEATPTGADYEIIPDRAHAVQRAVDLAYSCDQPTLVCLLARGTEGAEHIKGKLVPAPLDADLFNDAVKRHS